MIRLLPAVVLLTGIGAMLLLGEFRWFRRPRLADRVRPFLAGAARPQNSPAADPLRLSQLMIPTAERIGDRVAAALGVTEGLEIRLRRIHETTSARQFRTRQVGLSLALGALAALVAIAVRMPASIITIAAGAASLLTFLIIEQQLASRSARWQRRIFLELPIVAEQLGMLLSAGFSMGHALTRISRRSDAAIALDLSVVVGRLQQGVDETTALREWAELVKVPAVDRLLSVLALNREATDLGALITEESRAARAEVHRELIELLERRAQQVWIPVTVATLVPGLLFLAVPFFEAIRLFTTT